MNTLERLENLYNNPDSYIYDQYIDDPRYHTEISVECTVCGCMIEKHEHYIEINGEAICQECEGSVVIHKVV